MMIKKLSLLLTIVLVLAALAACSSAGDPTGNKDKNMEEELVKAFEQGVIVQKDEGGHRWLVSQYKEQNGSASVEATWLRIDNTLLEDHTGAKLTANDFLLGQQVEVWVSGPVAESYPSQGTAGKMVLLQAEQGSTTITIQRHQAIQAAMKLVQPQMFWAIKEASFHTETNAWRIELIDGNHVEKVTTTVVNATTGEIVPAIVAENDAFRLFGPAPDSEVSGSFTVSGQARVFEAAFSWSLEDGHNILAEGHTMANQGAPEWGDFEFEVNYKQATNSTLMLIVFVHSAKDGSPEHQLIIPLKHK